MLFAVQAQPNLINFHLVYSAFPTVNGKTSQGSVWSRTITAGGSATSEAASQRLMNWNAWNETKGQIVAYGGSAGTGGSAAECPHVVHHAASGYWFLFRTQHYTPNGGQTSVYASTDPSNFG